VFRRITDEGFEQGLALAAVWNVDPADLPERIEIGQRYATRAAELRLSPGMPAEVMILTGEHTLFDYMLAPLRDSLNRGMREN
jgi:multidrug efflux pump subunit AcrA (membrane-fusion protein)